VLLSTQQPIGWRSLNDRLAAAVEADLDHADATAAETQRARDFMARMDGRTAGQARTLTRNEARALDLARRQPGWRP